jgi:N utilization substance protein A
MDIAVENEKLSLAIGRGGQNVRLASELTGWTLNVMDESAAEEKSEEESKVTVQIFVDQLDVDEEVALILVQEGFTTVEEVAYVPRDELLDIDEFEEEIVDELRSRAQDALLTKAIATEEKLGGNTPSAELIAMEGMSEELALEMGSHEILTVDDLADQSIDDLMVVQGMNEELAATLIMKARESWFAEAEAAEAAAK